MGTSNASDASRRDFVKATLALGVGGGALFACGGALAEQLACPAAKRIEATGKYPPANKKIGVSVAYLGVPFYANYKMGLEDGAKQFGFTYELMDGKMGDLPTELSNLQHFGSGGFDAVLLTPSGEGILPALRQLLTAGVPVIEVNNRAGFGKEGIAVTTYVGANDVEFGKLQMDLVVQQFGDKPVKVGYVMGPLSSPAQVLRAQGWDQGRAAHSSINEIARVSDDFDSAKALAVVQDLLSRFPKGEIDAIVMQGPEGAAAVQYAIQNSRDDVKFFAGDYPADIRQLIYDGKVVATIDQDPYPQAYHAMEMAYDLLMGKESEIKKPYFLPLPLISQKNANEVPPAWGC
jgi:ABC-type sugar transport system substrate-binding protein